MFVKVAYLDTDLRRSKNVLEVETGIQRLKMQLRLLFSLQEKNNFFWKIIRQISYVQEALLEITCLWAAGVSEFLVGTVSF